jgi:oligosaccharyltransferase complex subunit epsilon
MFGKLFKGRHCLISSSNRSERRRNTSFLWSFYPMLCVEVRMSTPLVTEIAETVKRNYFKETDSRIRLIDLLIVSLGVLSILQIGYVAVGRSSFPFNSFLSGLLSSGGSMVLAVALRSQLTNRHMFADIKPERAFADFLIAMAVLHIAVINFLG